MQLNLRVFVLVIFTYVYLFGTTYMNLMSEAALECSSASYRRIRRIFPYGYDLYSARTNFPLLSRLIGQLRIQFIFLLDQLIILLLVKHFLSVSMPQNTP